MTTRTVLDKADSEMLVLSGFNVVSKTCAHKSQWGGLNRHYEVWDFGDSDCYFCIPSSHETHDENNNHKLNTTAAPRLKYLGVIISGASKPEN